MNCLWFYRGKVLGHSQSIYVANLGGFLLKNKCICIFIYIHMILHMCIYMFVFYLAECHNEVESLNYLTTVDKLNHIPYTFRFVFPFLFY